MEKNAETIKTSDPCSFHFWVPGSSQQCFLVLLAAAMMKFQLEEGKISAAVTVIYLGSAFLGGKDRWQKDGEQKNTIGAARRNVLFCSAFFLLTLILKRNIDPSSIQTITTACLCMGGGMLERECLLFKSISCKSSYRFLKTVMLK